MNKKLFAILFILNAFLFFSADDNIFFDADKTFNIVNKAIVYIYNKPTDKYKTYYNWIERGTESGSGLFISSDGLIATNYHVIRGANAENLTITMYNKKEYSIEIIGYDEYIDFALLKIKNYNETENISFLNFIDSEKIKIGQKVIAIGNPQGLKLTYTAGIISAKNRVDIGLNYIENYIQFDAAINPGSSGGPVITPDGKVIGISSAMSMNSEGLGFAIPTELVKQSLDKILNKKKITYSGIGVYVKELTKQIKDIYNISETKGLLILGVDKNSQFDKAGITFPYIIKKIDGSDIESYYDMYRIIFGKNINEDLEFTLSNDKLTKNIVIKLKERNLENTLKITDFFRTFLNMEIDIENFEKINTDDKKNSESDSENNKKFHVKAIYLDPSFKSKLNISEGDYIYFIYPKCPTGVKEFIFNEEQLEFIINNSYIFDNYCFSFDLFTSENEYKINTNEDNFLINFKKNVKLKEQNFFKRKTEVQYF